MRALLVALVPALFGLCISRTARADLTDQCIAESEEGQRLMLGHHFVASRPHFIACGRVGCPALVSRDCVERLRQAETAMATVLLVVRRPDGSDVQGATVYADGATSPTPLDGTAIDMDPGPHTLRFVIPGGDEIVRRITVEQGARLQNVTVLVAPPPEASPQPAPAPPPNAALPDTPSDSPSRPWGGWRTTAYVVGGLGVAGLLAGGVLGALAESASSREKSDCAILSACTNIGPARSDYGSAATLADASTVAFVGGGALAAAGIVIWLAAPSPQAAPSAATQVIPGLGSLLIRGIF